MRLGIAVALIVAFVLGGVTGRWIAKREFHQRLVAMPIPPIPAAASQDFLKEQSQPSDKPQLCRVAIKVEKLWDKDSQEFKTSAECSRYLVNKVQALCAKIQNSDSRTFVDARVAFGTTKEMFLYPVICMSSLER